MKQVWKQVSLLMRNADRIAKDVVIGLRPLKAVDNTETSMSVGTVFLLGSYSFIIAPSLAAQDLEHTTPWLNNPSFMQ